MGIMFSIYPGDLVLISSNSEACSHGQVLWVRPRFPGKAGKDWRQGRDREADGRAAVAPSPRRGEEVSPSVTCLCSPLTGKCQPEARLRAGPVWLGV